MGRNPNSTSLSVVVPTFNRATLLPATLDAILAQDTPANEVIIVDDGSTDETPAVLAAYQSPVRVIRTENGGDLVARNTGVRAASGRLVAFCDSDDIWRPEFLTAMAGLWEHVPNLLAAYANFQAIRHGVWDQRTKFDDAPPDFWTGLRPTGVSAGVFERSIVERLLEFQPFFPSAMVVERAGFLAFGGWDEAVSRIVGTDFATVMRLAEQPIGVVRSPLVGIRRHHGNFSRDVQAMKLGDARILEHILKTRPTLAIHRVAVLASIADRRAAAADIAYDRRDFGSVRLIQHMLPSTHRPLRRRIKGWISRLPAPIAGQAAKLTSLLARGHDAPPEPYDD